MHYVSQSYAVIQRAVCSQLLRVDGNIDKALELKTRTTQLLFCALKDMQCVDKKTMTKRRCSQAMSMTLKEQDGEVKTSTIVCS